MDQVKQYASLIFVKHLFWTLSGVIAVLGIVAWLLATMELQGQFTKNKSDIESKHSMMDAVLLKDKKEIVNATSAEKMNAEIQRRKQEVYEAWVSKHDRQQKVLVMPDGLSDRFKNEVNKVLDGRPIEEKVKYDPSQRDPLIATLREHYRNTIKSLLPTLAKTIGAKWSPVEVTRSNNSPGGGNSPFGRGSPSPAPIIAAGEGGKTPSDAESYVVNWNPQDQGNLQFNHFEWPHAERELPSTAEILYSMEDYWVLKSLMQIIARTNVVDETGLAAEHRHQAAIRDIHFIELGKDIANIDSNTTTNSKGQVYRLLPAVGEGGEGVPPEGMAPPATMPTEGMPTEGVDAAAAAALLQHDPAQNRYVNVLFQPIPASKLRTAAESDVPEEADLAVAKRIPIRMRMTMDQRKLNKFLVECGNSDLMVEVRQVRVNPEAANLFNDSGAVSGEGSPGGFRNAGGYGGGGFGRGAVQPPAGEGQTGDAQSRQAWDVDVEILAMVYIFNPPSKKRLKLTDEDVAKFAGAAVAPSTPAGTAVPAAGEPADDESATEPAGDAPPAASPPGANPPAAIPPAGTPPPVDAAGVPNTRVGSPAAG